MDVADEALADANEVQDPAYRWAVRVLYVAILGANLYVLYDMVKDTPDVIVARAQLKAWWERLQNCEGCARRKEQMTKMVNRGIWQAQEYVNGAGVIDAQSHDVVEPEAP